MVKTWATTGDHETAISGDETTAESEEQVPLKHQALERIMTWMRGSGRQASGAAGGSVHVATRTVPAQHSVPERQQPPRPATSARVPGGQPA